MNKQYHILNGDALRERFPKSIEGEIIVARECLVDGSVEGNSLEELFVTRAQFISESYKGYSEESYHQTVVPEFRKMQQIPEDAEIHLWFEEDLFCQVNFWFVLHLLYHSQKRDSIFLIRPKKHSPYSFAGLSDEELIACCENKLQLTHLEELAKLWVFYQSGNTAELLDIAKKLDRFYPFLVPAIEAHIDRIPSKGKLGRPSRTILQITEELQTTKFGLVFSEFLKREAIYGFGDLQVKGLFDTLQSENHVSKI